MPMNEDHVVVLFDPSFGWKLKTLPAAILQGELDRLRIQAVVYCPSPWLSSTSIIMTGL
jgi:hypothetical protein